MAYATTTQLAAEKAARIAADKVNATAIAALTARVAALETPAVIVPPPIVVPPPSGLPVIEGYGRHALDGLPLSNVYTIDTPGTTGKGTWPDGWAWLKANGGGGILRFAGKLDIDLAAAIWRADGLSHFMLDGRGADVTFRNGCLWFETLSYGALVNLRNRGGWAGGQAADGITFAGSGHDFAAVNVSVSGAADEGMSTTRSCVDYTYQDCLWGPGMDATHNYGSLNEFLTHRGSHIRSTFVGLEYRCPKIGYAGDANTSPISPDTTGEVINLVAVDCVYGLTAESGGRVIEAGTYYQNVTNPSKAITAATITAGTAPLTPIEAARFAKAWSGSLPHDAVDAALLARIAA